MSEGFETGEATLEGVVPILVTPFAEDGSVDLDELGRELEFLVGAGVRWVGFGFGSESPRLSAAELEAAMARTVAVSAGRLRVIGNAEMTGVASGIESVARVRRAGADLAMLRPSGLQGVGDDEMFETVAAVAAGGGLGLVVQDAPQATGVQLSPQLLARLLVEVPEVAAVKVEPPAPGPKMSLIRNALGGADGTVLGGSGGLDYLHELDRGARGTMPGPAHPELFAAVQLRRARGERKAAFALFATFMPLMLLASRSMEAFLFTQKHVLRRRGVLAESRLRPPHAPLDTLLAGEIDELIELLGLLELLEACRKELGL